MRVTNNMMLRNTTSNINNNKYSVNSLNNQMSSQKKSQDLPRIRLLPSVHFV